MLIILCLAFIFTNAIANVYTIFKKMFRFYWKK